jgi:hypothetical protein
MTSSSSHWKLTWSRHDIGKKLLNWRYATITHSLTHWNWKKKLTATMQFWNQEIQYYQSQGQVNFSMNSWSFNFIFSFCFIFSVWIEIICQNIDTRWDPCNHYPYYILNRSPHTYMSLANFRYPVDTDWVSYSQTILNYSVFFPSFWLWPHLMNVIPETRIT